MFKIAKLTQQQVDRLPQNLRKEYDTIKDATENFTEGYEDFKDNELRLFNLINKVLGDETATTKPKTAPKKKATTKKAAAKKKPNAPKRKSIAYNRSIALEDLHPHGKVYDLAVVDGTCPQVGVVLNMDTKIYVKGNTHIIAKRNELVSLVEVGQGIYRQFNVIGNMGDKCIFINTINPDGSREPYSCGNKKQETVKSKNTPCEDKTKDDAKTKSDPKIVKTKATKKDDPCPPQPCEDKPKPDQKKAAERKRKKEVTTLATYLHHAASNAHIGNADTIVSKIIRREDMRVVLELSPYKAVRKGLKADTSKAEYFLFSDEQDGKLRKTEKPSGKYSIIDAKTESLKKGEKTKSSLLDIVYTKDGDIELCLEVEKELQKCRFESCAVELQAYYKGLMKACTDKAGQKLFIQEMTKEFELVFNAQKRGESFWDAYLRIKTSKQGKATKTQEDEKKK